MNEEIIGKVYAHMRNVFAADTEEYEVAFGGIFSVFYPGAIIELFQCSAHKINTVNLSIQFLGEAGAVNARGISTTYAIGSAIPFINELV